MLRFYDDGLLAEPSERHELAVTVTEQERQSPASIESHTVLLAATLPDMAYHISVLD